MTYESERQTRKRRIDPKLRNRGPTVVPHDAAIFERSEGWGRANREFNGALGQMIAQINEEVAA